MNQLTSLETGLVRAGVRTEDNRVPWRVAAEAYPMSRAQLAAFESVSADCFWFLVVVAEAIRQRSDLGVAICRALGNDPHKDPMASTLLSRSGLLVGMTRPDVIRTGDGGLKVAEIETMIGGLGMSAVLRSCYGAGGLSGIPEAYAAMMWGMYADHRGASRQARPGRLAVGVVNPATKSSYDWEFVVLGDYVAPLGLDLILGRPEEVVIRAGGEVWLGRHRLDVMHRFFRLSEIRHTKSVLDTLGRISQKQYVPMVQPWLEILEEKALMALFCNPNLRSAWRNALGSDLFGRLAQVIPATWIVGSDSQMAADLYSGSIDRRRFWLKKSSGTWGGKGAFFGGGLTATKWQKVLATAWGDFLNGQLWVVQEHWEPARETIPVYDRVSGRVTELSSGGRFNPFTFWSPDGPRLADVRVTARDNHKIHGASDATFAPVGVRE